MKLTVPRQHTTRSHKAAKESISAKDKTFNVQRFRKDFPILREKVHGKPLIYLDNAATTQKPEAVLEALDGYYRHTNANIHRGVHFLSEKATAQYEGAREKVRAFLNAKSASEIVFTRGATEAINLVAQTWGRQNLGPGDEILLTVMEHHSNIVPWQMIAAERGAKVKAVPINDRGELIPEELGKLLTPQVKLLALTHVSNALGTVNPIKGIVALAHAVGAKVLVDGAQAVPHVPVDVQDLDCDFYVFSGHKVYGPTGIGVLYGKYALLDAVPPYQGGGDMIMSVTIEKTLYKKPPHKFEAGTPAIAEVIGLGAALDYVSAIGLSAIAAHEKSLLEYGTALLKEIPGVMPVGTAAHKAGVLSFTLGEIHPHDIGTILDRQGIAIRAGHHCAQPVMDRFDIPATARASLGLYNTKEELDALAKGIKKVIEVFR
ncbi:MAG TPA: cysteine desulfurase [bacterium]|nr:cysteine desulfurase [bacterium]